MAPSAKLEPLPAGSVPAGEQARRLAQSKRDKALAAKAKAKSQPKPRQNTNNSAKKEKPPTKMRGVPRAPTPKMSAFEMHAAMIGSSIGGPEMTRVEVFKTRGCMIVNEGSGLLFHPTNRSVSVLPISSLTTNDDFERLVFYAGPSEVNRPKEAEIGTEYGWGSGGTLVGSLIGQSTVFWPIAYDYNINGTQNFMGTPPNLTPTTFPVYPVDVIGPGVSRCTGGVLQIEVSCGANTYIELAITRITQTTFNKRFVLLDTLRTTSMEGRSTTTLRCSPGRTTKHMFASHIENSHTLDKWRGCPSAFWCKEDPYDSVYVQCVVYAKGQQDMNPRLTITALHGVESVMDMNNTHHATPQAPAIDAASRSAAHDFILSSTSAAAGAALASPVQSALSRAAAAVGSATSSARSFFAGASELALPVVTEVAEFAPLVAL